ncbi:MAG TPA: hypothetical protein VH575_10930, partial [Gemmataceae bacterium]
MKPNDNPSRTEEVLPTWDVTPPAPSAPADDAIPIAMPVSPDEVNAAVPVAQPVETETPAAQPVEAAPPAQPT